MTDTYIDGIAVERAMHGDAVRLTKHERAHAIRLMTERGYSAAAIAERLRIAERTVFRHRSATPPRPARRSRYQAYQWPRTEEWHDDAARHTGGVLVSLCRLLDAGGDAVTVGDTLVDPTTGRQNLGPIVAVEEAAEILAEELRRLAAAHRPQPDRDATAPWLSTHPDVDDWERAAVDEVNAHLARLEWRAPS